MSTTLHVAPTVKTTFTPTNFLVEMQLRAVLAKEHSRFLRQEAKLLREDRKRMRRLIFSDREFHKLSPKLVEKRHLLLLSIWQEISATRSTRDKLREAIFLEKLTAPEMTLADLEKMSRVC